MLSKKHGVDRPKRHKEEEPTLPTKKHVSIQEEMINLRKEEEEEEPI